MRVVERVCDARMDLDAVELYQRIDLWMHTNEEAADGTKSMFVCPVHSSDIGCDRQAGLVFKVFAGGQVK